MKPWMKVALISACVTIVLVAASLTGLYFYAQNLGEERCRAHRFNAQWSRIGHQDEVRNWRGKLRERTEAEKIESLRQLEMIARIEDNKAQDQGKKSFCPPDWGKWGWLEAWRMVWKSDPKRWEIVFRVAQSSRKNNYSYPLPPELNCRPIDYKATLARWPKGLTNRKIRAAARIGTMTIYCPKE